MSDLQSTSNTSAQTNAQVQRTVVEQLLARPTTDGDGVQLLRVFGGQAPERFDPFLMLDEFGSDTPSAYIGGFPSHPHRGFETVTYMLQGKMEHRDHMGNVGLVDDGDVQWMTAGRGVIHSEMPRQTEGKMRGFQLWVNLPANKKMQPASYSEIKSSEIPMYDLQDSEGRLIRVRAISGNAEANGEMLQGHTQVPDTEVLYLDVCLSVGAIFNVSVPAGHGAAVYVYDGSVRVAGQQTVAQVLSRLTTDGDITLVNSADIEARLLVIAGKPIGESIVQYGPFVMNSMAEIEQAVKDFRDGSLTGS
ncbi:MAG: redox-sensitive bicupin YhaK (pirin superfamily) [Candidatus Pseudothioglobus sp.]|jgi:redox-sensitive bicupin YhaK (pirin superfamily)